jgi:hypothetical protein
VGSPSDLRVAMTAADEGTGVCASLSAEDSAPLFEFDSCAPASRSRPDAADDAEASRASGALSATGGAG